MLNGTQHQLLLLNKCYSSHSRLVQSHSSDHVNKITPELMANHLFESCVLRKRGNMLLSRHFLQYMPSTPMKSSIKE